MSEANTTSACLLACVFVGTTAFTVYSPGDWLASGHGRCKPASGKQVARR